MKKVIIFSTLLLAGLVFVPFSVLAMQPPPPVTAYDLNPNGIKRLSNRNDVKTLQRYLNGQFINSSDLGGLGGTITPLSPDGWYGIKTKKIIKMFQSKNGLKVDGIFGKDNVEKAIYLESNKIVCDTISPDRKYPRIKIISPNGGEVFHIGDLMNIKWQGCHMSKDWRVNIFLFNRKITDSSLSHTIIASNIPITDNNYTFKIPLSMINEEFTNNLNGKDSYSILVDTGTPGPGSSSGISDSGDDPFSILPQ